LPINPGHLNGQLTLRSRISIDEGFCFGEQAIPIRFGPNESDVVTADCETGSFSIANVRQGEYTLRINATADNGIAEYGLLERVESINAGDTRQLAPIELRLVRGALTISVDRMGLNGETGPLSDVLVTLRKNTLMQAEACAAGNPPQVNDSVLDQARDLNLATTREDGVVAFVDIVGGLYTVHLQRGTAYRAADNCIEVTFAQGQENEQDLTFGLAQTLSEEPASARGVVNFEGLGLGESGPIAEISIGSNESVRQIGSPVHSSLRVWSKVRIG
jgi:hypothetical protein